MKLGQLLKKIQKLIIKNNANSLRHLKCSNTKKLWQHVNKITKKTDDGMEILPNITAVSLNKYCSTISTDPQYIEPINKSSTVRNQNYISVLTTYKILERLKPTAAGPDGIPTWFFEIISTRTCNSTCSYIQFIDNSIGGSIAMESGKDSSNPKN